MSKKVKIYTYANMTPDFIEKQYETIKKFVKDEDWEFIVYNNTSIIAHKRRVAIKQICKKLGLKCPDVRFRSYFSGGSYIMGWSLNWTFHRFIRWEKDTIHVLIDSDMFFIKDINFNEFLGDNDMCAVHQRRGEIDYLWNGIVVYKGAEIPNKHLFDFRLDTINGERTDCGGRTYFWLKKNSPDYKIKWIKHTNHNKIENTEMLPASIRSEYNPEFDFQFIEDFLVHSRGGSNWNKDTRAFLTDKKNYLNKFLNEVLNGNADVNISEELYECMQ